MNRKKQFSLISNLLIAGMELGALLLCFIFEWPSTFKYYTTISNVFAGISCFLLVLYQIINYKNSKEIPYFVIIFKYISACMLSVTFLVVLFVLIPASGDINEMIRLLFSPKLLFHHTLCPILCIISFVFFENEYKIEKKYIFYSLIPTLLYAIIFIFLNAFNIVSGPYFFLKVNNQPIYMSIIWFVAIMSGAYGISTLLWFLNKRGNICKS